MRLKIPICVLILFLNVGRKYQTTHLKPHYSANFTTVPVLTVHHNWRCSGVPLYSIPYTWLVLETALFFLFSLGSILSMGFNFEFVCYSKLNDLNNYNIIFIISPNNNIFQTKRPDIRHAKPYRIFRYSGNYFWGGLS